MIEPWMIGLGIGAIIWIAVSFVVYALLYSFGRLEAEEGFK